jgi:hypothetical protein
VLVDHRELVAHVRGVAGFDCGVEWNGKTGEHAFFLIL